MMTSAHCGWRPITKCRSGVVEYMQVAARRHLPASIGNNSATRALTSLISRSCTTRSMVSGLVVDEKKMRANLDITRGLIVSEAVMMGLGPHIGRQYAHDLVYDVCRQVVATGRTLLDLLAENREVAKHLDRAALEKLCDPANYLGQAGEMVDRVLAMRGK